MWLYDGSRCCSPKGTKGIALDIEALNLKVVDVVDGDWEAAGVIVQTSPTAPSRTCWSRCPSANSRWRSACSTTIPRPTFDEAVREQNAKLSEGKNADLQKLISKGQTWTVELILVRTKTRRHEGSAVGRSGGD